MIAYYNWQIVWRLGNSWQLQHFHLQLSAICLIMEIKLCSGHMLMNSSRSVLDIFSRRFGMLDPVEPSVQLPAFCMGNGDVRSQARHVCRFT